MATMISGEVYQLLFALVSVVTAGVMLAGGVVAFRAARGGGAVLVMIGGGVFLLNNLMWFGFLVGKVAMVWDYSSSGVQGMFSVMQFAGSLSMLLMATGVLMLGIVMTSMRRRSQALEEMLAAGQSEDR